MGGRDIRISRSIVSAILSNDDDRLTAWRAIQRFFALYGLYLVRFRPELFRRLRNQVWGLPDEEYRSSFQTGEALIPKGDMGYSGSVSTDPGTERERESEKDCV